MDVNYLFRSLGQFPYRRGSWYSLEYFVSLTKIAESSTLLFVSIINKSPVIVLAQSQNDSFDYILVNWFVFRVFALSALIWVGYDDFHRRFLD